MRITIGRGFGLLTGLFACGFLGFFLYDYVFEEPVAARMEMQLEAELVAVKPMPGATLMDHSVSHKTRHALVRNAYSIQAGYPAIRSYYDLALSSEGWEFCIEEKHTTWGQDVGNIGAYYRKGDLEASVEYSGERSGPLSHYSLDMSWGLVGECE